MYKIIGADGNEYGPVSLEQLRQWQSEGRVNAQTRLLVAGDTTWKTLADLAELAPTDEPAIPQPIRPPASSWASRRTNGMAVAGLALGVCSLLLACCCCGGLPFNLLGLIISAIGLAQINRHPELYQGRSAAVAGLIISGLSLVLGAALMMISVTLNWDEITREIERF